MTTLVHEFRATYAFIERNANLVKRYWSWELVWMIYSIANSLSVSFIGLGMERIGGGQNVDGRYLVLYLVIGTLVWRYLSLIFYWITEVISIERWEGTIEYTLMAPIRRITHMAGQTFFAVIYSLLFTAVILVVTAVLFQLDLSDANLLGGTLMLLAGSLSLSLCCFWYLASTTRLKSCRSRYKGWQFLARQPMCWTAHVALYWRDYLLRSYGLTFGRRC